MTKHDFLVSILNNLTQVFSDWVKIELKEDYSGVGEDFFYFRMDYFYVCVSIEDNYNIIRPKMDFNEYSAKIAAKRIEESVTKIYIKRLFKEYGTNEY